MIPHVGFICDSIIQIIFIEFCRIGIKKCRMGEHRTVSLFTWYVNQNLYDFTFLTFPCFPLTHVVARL